MSLLGFVLLALLGHKGIKRATASPLLRGTNNRPCTTLTVQVPITALNHLYDVVQVNNNIDAVHFEQDLDTWNSPSIEERITENITVSETYNIHAQLCVPPHGVKKSYLQVASHGGGFDSRYWDVRVEPEQHSYIDAALEAGYSILTYDRIGSGQSSHPSAYTDVQLPAEVEVLRAISQMVRDGTISHLTSDFFSVWNSSTTFDKVVHVGHSLGSIVTYGLLAVYPDLSDAAVLTGFIIDTEVFASRQASMDLQYAPDNDPQLFADSSSGYLVPGTPSAYQANFFTSRVNATTGVGGFDPKLLDYAYSIRQPTPLVEMGSGIVMYLQYPTAAQYTGPVQLMVGEFDYIVCLGDCRNTYTTTQLDRMFPQAKEVDINLQPGTGHGLPFHRNATLGFKATFDWLSSNGL